MDHRLEAGATHGLCWDVIPISSLRTSGLWITGWKPLPHLFKNPVPHSSTACLADRRLDLALFRQGQRLGDYVGDFFEFVQ